MHNCQKCGNTLSSKNGGFCQECGYPIDRDSTLKDGVRCTKCGDAIISGNKFCTKCGEKALSQTEYSKRIQKYNRYKRLRFAYIGFHSLTKALLAMIIAIVVVLVLSAIANNTALDNIAKFIIGLAIIAIPLYIAIIILLLVLWLRYKVSYKDFELLKQEVRKQPELFYRPIPKIVISPKYKPVAPVKAPAVVPSDAVSTDSSPNQQPQSSANKTLGKSFGGIFAGLISITALIAIVAALSGHPETNTTSSSRSYTSQRSSTSKTLSGRWESSNGQTAIVFQGNTAYFGNKYNSNSDIIAECKHWNKGIATYSISGNKITFKHKTGTYSYNFNDTTISYEGERIVKD